MSGMFYNVPSFNKDIGSWDISEHPVNVNDIKNSMRLDPKATLHDINQITPEKQGNHARVVGVINEIRTILIKNGQSAGQKMAIISLEDDTDKIDITLFADSYKLAKNYLEINSLIAFDGEISFSEQYGLGMKAEALTPLLPKGDLVPTE